MVVWLLGEFLLRFVVVKLGVILNIFGLLVVNFLLKVNVKVLIVVLEELYFSVLIGCVLLLVNIVSEVMLVVIFIILLLFEFFNNGKKVCIIWKVLKKLILNFWCKVLIFNLLGSVLKFSVMFVLLINKCKWLVIL